MPSVREDAYEKYMAKIELVRKCGYSNAAIIDELLRERATIMPRCVAKQATLVQDRNIYKKREAARSAYECIRAIDRIIKELEPKETLA